MKRLSAWKILTERMIDMGEIRRATGKRYVVRALTALVAVWACTFCVSAQEDYRFDAGVGVGMTGYLGDANTANLWKHPGWDIEGLFRYVINPRMALKTNIYVGGLSGNSADMTNVYPEGEDFEFNTTFYEAGEMFEFNFLPYGIGESYRKLRRFTPYITAGIGFMGWKANGHGGFSLNIPMGVGAKYKVNKRLNLGVEFLMKKCFSDKLDGKVDPYGIPHAFMKNTDWYSTFTFTVSYEFSLRCATCHYSDRKTVLKSVQKNNKNIKQRDKNKKKKK